MIEQFDLSSPALDRMATIIRGADTDRLELAPESAGLLAISMGLSRLHQDDDAGMLRDAMTLYDALSCACRQARRESHAWTPSEMAVAEPDIREPVAGASKRNVS